MRNMENKSKKSKKNQKFHEKEWLISKGGGSGEGQQKLDDTFDESQSSSSDASNVKIAYFDPPIERFAFVQKFGNKNIDDTNSQSNLSRSIAGSQLFMKKPKGKKKKSAGTGNDGNSASDMSDLSDNSDNRFAERGSFPGLRNQKKKIESPNSEMADKSPFFFSGAPVPDDAPNFPELGDPGTLNSSNLTQS